MIINEKLKRKIGRRLRDARLNKNYTLRDVEKLTNISNSCIYKYENGKPLYSIKVLNCLCNAYNIKIEDLFNA